MAFEFEVENLEGMDEAMQKNYIKVGDKFQLDVNGVPDVTKLKNTADARKVERDALKTELKDINDAKAVIEAAKAETERKRLEEKGEFKTLAETSQREKEESDAKYLELEQKVNKKEVKQLALVSVSGMTDNETSAMLLNEQAEKYVEHKDGKAIISGPDGISDAKGLREYLAKQFPQLVSGSKAGGGGAGGSGGDGNTGKSNLGGTIKERVNALNDQFPELKT